MRPGRSRGCARALPCAATLALVCLARAQERLEAPPPPPGVALWRVGEIRIETGDVFPDEEAERNLLYRAANFLHATTRPHVIAREVEAVLREGDLYLPEKAAEVERNLRRLGFIAEAVVEPSFRPDGKVDVLVRTRDRFTLRAGASVASFSGETRARASLGEDNLLGWGKKARLTYLQTPDVEGGEILFEDPQFLGSRHVLDAALRRTDEGTSGEFALERPFDTLETPWSYGARLGRLEDEVEFFEAGETVVEVERTTDRQEAFVLRGLGSRERRRLVGLHLARERTDFGDVEGPGAPGLRVPGDLDSLTFAPIVTAQDYARYFERTHLDALDFVEDVPIGTSVSSSVGLRRRSESGEGVRAEVIADGALLASADLWREGLAVVRAHGAGRYGEGEGRAWRAEGFLHLYDRSLPRQTLAANLAADFVWEAEDLPVELRLGEESGLRGYETRALSGTKRLRLNLEDRIDLPVEILSFRLGLVGFFDAGTVWDRGESFEWREVKRSVGLGLRVGSVPFLGRGVVRLDLGFPLDEIEGTDRRITLTVAAGQIFRLFDNPEGLSKDF